MAKVIAQAISLEKFCGYQLFCENRETTPPRMISNMQHLNSYGPIYDPGLQL